KVTVIVVPRTGADPARPRPSDDLLREVRAYLDRRRDLTADLAVRGPRYLPIQVAVTVTLFGREADAGIDRVTLERELAARATAYLHPLTGGADGNGWLVGQRVHTAGLFRVLMPRADIGYISDLKVSALLPDYLEHLPNEAAVRPGEHRPDELDQGQASVRVEDYELVCSAPAHAITADFEQQ
ncbi:MAG: hypothetical protein IT429_00770, partial [Gemmataceae bacterium]|nr:hypothetical protein [Gemmataceae bacterium]